MLSSLYDLETETDGRYATDVELSTVAEYLESYRLRLTIYRKIQAAETQIIQRVHARARQIEPGIMVYANADASKTCERDMTFVLRQSAIAFLVDSTDLLEERVLLWLQTIMRSFKDHHRHSDLLYRVLQEVMQQYLTPAEAALFCPILEVVRQYLGTT